MFFKRFRRIIDLINGDPNALRNELWERDPAFAMQESQKELIRMRVVARRWGIGPSDHAYPDIWYVQGALPTYEHLDHKSDAQQLIKEREAYLRAGGSCEDAAYPDILKYRPDELKYL